MEIFRNSYPQVTRLLWLLPQDPLNKKLQQNTSSCTETITQHPFPSETPFAKNNDVWCELPSLPSLQPFQQLVKAAGLLQRAADFLPTSFNSSLATQKWSLYHTQFLPPVFSPPFHRYYDREVMYRQTDVVEHFIYTAEEWESVLATVSFVLLRLRKSKLQVITRSPSHRGTQTNSLSTVICNFVLLKCNSSCRG